MILISRAIINNNFIKYYDQKQKNEKTVPIFAKTGRLDREIYHISKHMNPRRAFYNCPLTSYKTAYLLERGILPKMALTCPNIPRPMSNFTLMMNRWPELFIELSPNRSCELIDRISKVVLERLILNLGNHTHALVGGLHPSFSFLGKVYKTGMGHMWNCVCVQENGQVRMIVLDSYAKRFHKKGIEDQEAFFAQYDAENLSAVVFFDKSPANKEFILQVKRHQLYS